MVFPRDYIPEGGNDNNTRSRSFLFIGYALFAMTGMDNINELLVPENGLIALNVPLMKQELVHLVQERHIHFIFPCGMNC